MWFDTDGTSPVYMFEQLDQKLTGRENFKMQVKEGRLSRHVILDGDDRSSIRPRWKKLPPSNESPIWRIGTINSGRIWHTGLQQPADGRGSPLGTVQFASTIMQVVVVQVKYFFSTAKNMSNKE